MKHFIKYISDCLISLFQRRRVVSSETRTLSTTDKKRIARGVKAFFDRNYELRYNVIKQQEEFRPRHRDEAEQENADGQKKNSDGQNFAGEHQHFHDERQHEGWQQMTDRHLRRIAFEQMLQVGVAWSVDVELYVRSALTPDYNPIADYLSRCGQWDGQTDYIRQFAGRVPTAYAQWPDLFHRWFLAMVAQWQQRSRDYGNSLVPMLIGGQGTHKSTFCKLILPPSLREYYVDDIKLDSPEQVERMLGRMLLVNIDEYNAKTDREQAKIKRVLTERDVQTRKMRSDQYVMLPRMASFIATTNDRQPLTDPTGSRRYLCCELSGIIDTTEPVPHQQMYAQALYELDHGHSWHLTRQEEAAVEEHNRDFQCQASTEAVLLAYYEPAAPSKDHFLRAVDIQHELRRHLRQADVPTVTALVKALKSSGFRHGAYDGQRGWYARRRAPAADER